MKKRFTFLIAACVMLLTMAVHPLTILGQAKTDYEWVETDFDDLTASDIFVIAGTSNAKVYSLGNNASGKPTATEITINGTKITSNVTTAMQWKRVTVTGGYKFQSQAATSNYLRWSSGTTMGTNSTNSNNVFTWINYNNDGVYYLYNTAGTRYVCKYKAGSDWRAYSGANDISTNATVTKFYKRQEVSSDPVVTITNPTGGTISVANGDTPVSSGANIASGTTLRLDKTIDAGYTFSEWKVFKTDDENTTINVDNNNQFTMPEYNVTVTAVVNANPSHTVTLNSVTGGTIEADPSGSVREGVTVTITATPDNNHVFGSWSVTGAASASTTDAQTTFTMSTSDVTVGASFTQAYHVTYNANAEGTDGSTTDNNKYVEGASATVLACGFSKAGYVFVKWNTQNDGNGIDYAPNASITIGTADVTLYAIWDIASYTVAVASSIADATITAVHSGGSIAEGSNASIKCGSTVSLLADGLASGKGVAWDVYKTGETSTKVTVTDNSFEVPAYNVTINATVGDLFERYTEETVVEGDYIIYDSKAMNNTVSSSRLGLTTVIPDDNKIISADASTYTWHIASNNGYMTIKNSTNYVYAKNTTSKDVGLTTTVDDKALWTFTRSTSTYLITNKSNSGTDYANLTNGGSYYACYSKGSSESSLYKRIASYQLDVLSPNNGVITANISGQSAIAEGANANVKVGATVTLVASPDPEYANDGWTVYKTGEPSTTVTVTDNQFTMPGYPVTVTTDFITAETVTLRYMVNGVPTDVDVKEGYIVTLKTAGEIDVPDGSTFNGWSSSATNFSTILTGSYTIPKGGATLYAVFTQSAPATFSFEITTGDFNTGGYYDGSKTTTARAATDETFDVTWHSYDVYKNGNMQWKSGSGYINNTTDLGTVLSVTVTSTAGVYTTYYGTTVQPSSGEAGTGKGYFKTSVNNTVGHTTSVVVTFVKNVDRKFSKVYDEDETTATGDIAINAPTLIPSGKVLNMGNHKLTVTSNYLTVADASCLVIGDGGQLICNNSVAATVKKSITASSASKGEGWYTISSPVNNKTAGGKNYETVAGVTNLVPATGKYDLYRFNETKDDSDENNKRWENYKVHGYDLEMGRGYIYRKNSSDELSFVGNTNVGNITYTLTCSNVPELAGFNLIGNPYPHSIAKGSGKAIQNGDYLATNYYVLSNNDTWDLCTDGSEIPSKQGILVQTVEGFNLTISDTPFTPVPGKYSNDNIRFSVANEQYEDVAYAWFDKGYGLNKIAHRNPDAPMLYIPQDGTNYATAIMSDDIKVFGLSFKAMTMGKYTLRTKANGDYTYLHVIDRLTGEDVDMLLDGEYSFVASPNDKENRFIVKLEYKPDYSEGNSDIFAYQSGSEILVSGEGELQIFDVTGRNVMTTTINGAEAINGLSNGVYIFRLVGNDIKTQKIVVR